MLDEPPELETSESSLSSESEEESEWESDASVPPPAVEPEDSQAPLDPPRTGEVEIPDVGFVDYDVCPHVQVHVRKSGRWVARCHKCDTRVLSQEYFVWCEECTKAVCSRCSLSRSRQL